MGVCGATCGACGRPATTRCALCDAPICADHTGLYRPDATAIGGGEFAVCADCCADADALAAPDRDMLAATGEPF